MTSFAHWFCLFCMLIVIAGALAFIAEVVERWRWMKRCRQQWPLSHTVGDIRGYRNGR